jgi:uncharacterized protein (TIGR03435 family)
MTPASPDEQDDMPTRLIAAVILSIVTIGVATASAGFDANFVSAAGALRAQTPPLVFDVATVKPTPLENTGDAQPSIVMFMAGGSFRRTNSTLRTLVRTAYNIQEFQVVGGPRWGDSNRYDIEAKAGRDATRDEMLHMLQSLLAERFKLRLHREMKQGPTYELVTVKSGSKLKTAPESTSANVRIGQYAGNRTTAQLAAYLAGILGRPVVNRSGLDGIFDMNLQFPEPYTGFGDPNGPSVFTALQEQMGLRLQNATGEIETYVIDDAQLPSEN